MTTLSPQTTLTINTLINSYKNLSSREKALFPKEIKKVLEANLETELDFKTALDIINLCDTPQLLKFSCISNFIESALFQCCRLLKANQLFSDENAMAVLNYPKSQQPSQELPKLKLPKLKHLFSAICTLQDHGLLVDAEKQVYLAVVMQHEKSPRQVAEALAILHKADLLNAKNIAVTTHPINPAAVAKILTLIAPLGLLSGEHAENNFKKVIKHTKPASLLLDIELLDPQDTKLQDKFEKIMRPRTYAAPLLLLGVVEGNIASIEINNPFSTPKTPKGVVASLIPGAF